MSFRFVAPTVAVSLLILGCAASPTDPAREARMWRAQLQRQQEAVRNDGRIGHIGYEGPASR